LYEVEDEQQQDGQSPEAFKRAVAEALTHAENRLGRRLSDKEVSRFVEHAYNSGSENWPDDAEFANDLDSKEGRQRWMHERMHDEPVAEPAFSESEPTDNEEVE
jgi:hypothetical protein